MRTHLHLAAGLALFATLTASLAYAQQDPNAPVTKGGRGGGGFGGGGGPGGFGGGGPGGFGGGGPGGFGGGGPGGFGGPGGRGNAAPGDSAEALLLNPAVQEDLAIDAKVVTKFKPLGEAATKEREKVRVAVPKMAEQQAAQERAAMAEMLAANGIAADPNAVNNNNGGGRGRGGNNGGPGGNNNQNNRLVGQMMNMALDSLQAKIDASFLKLLTAKQKQRLNQIKLQQEGSRAFTNNDDLIEKLGLSEEQLTNIRSVTRELQNTQGQARRDLFASIIPPDAANNNNNGGRGGRGGPGNMMANLDDATRAKLDEQMQALQVKNSADSMAAIGNILTTAQKGKYNSMIGAKFDVTKLRRNPGAPGAPGAAPATETAATKTATPKADTAATTKSTAPAKKSLRDQRGGN